MIDRLRWPARSTMVPAALLGVVLAVVLAAAPSGAAEGSTVGIRPASQQDWFRLSAAAGETISDVALVTNKTQNPVPVAIYAVDATVTPQGSFALQGREIPGAGIGAWTSVAISEAVLEPHSVLRVPFRITIPPDADPGDYSGGIVVELGAHPGTATDVGDQVSVQFNIVERVGVRTFVTVAGAVVKRLELGGMTWSRTPGGIEFRIPVRNTGSVRVVPIGSVRLGGWGVTGTTLPLTGPEVVLPGSSATLTTLWRHPPAFAKITAEATVEYSGAPLRTSVSLWQVPWRLALLVLALLTALAFLVRRLWRFAVRARRALRLVEQDSVTDPEAGGSAGAASSIFTELKPTGAGMDPIAPDIYLPETVAAQVPPDDVSHWLSLLSADETDEEQRPRAS